MSFIETFIAGVPVVTVLIGVVTGALVLSVLIGSAVVLRRNRRAVVAAVSTESAAATPAQAAAAIASAYAPQRMGGEETEQEAWEVELAERLDELETAFATLTGKLGRMRGLDADGADVLRALKARAGDIGSGDQGPAAGFRRSEEQEQLLRRVSPRTGARGSAVGA